ncbi:hypothetical protein brsh051_20520 [Brooklawnia propionicigenes]|uniref:Uncharacterized protein n=1 Tax=Brooklawnia propionicigenes TaxID=3041175 RepID=A0AAN0MHZ3_9ACTN|nr:hypothetical protein brsh051_20520 [Brooklawnia sp. SH051]
MLAVGEVLAHTQRLYRQRIHKPVRRYLHGRHLSGAISGRASDPHCRWRFRLAIEAGDKRREQVTALTPRPKSAVGIDVPDWPQRDPPRSESPRNLGGTLRPAVLIILACDDKSGHRQSMLQIDPREWRVRERERRCNRIRQGDQEQPGHSLRISSRPFDRKQAAEAVRYEHGPAMIGGPLKSRKPVPEIGLRPRRWTDANQVWVLILPSRLPVSRPGVPETWNDDHVRLSGANGPHHAGGHQSVLYA